MGPCFISAGGVALGVDVGDLLELERTLQRDGVGEPAAEEQEVVEVRVAGRQLGHSVLQQQRLAERGREVERTLDLRARRRVVEDAAHAAELQGRGVQRDDRADHALRARHGDLGTDADQHRAVGQPRGLRARGVADRELRAPRALRLLHRREGVDRLARLADGDDERVLVQHGPPVAELRGVVDLGGDAREALDEVAGDHRRVERGAHAHEHDAVEVAHARLVEPEALDLHAWGVEEVAAAHRIECGVGLLVDLLQHEVPEPALDRRDRVERLRLGLALDGLPLGVRELDAAGPDVGDLAGSEERDRARQRQDGGEVRRHELLGHAVLAVPDDDAARVPHTRRHEPARLVGGDRDEGVRALGLADHPPHRVGEVGTARDGVGDEVREHLGVGVRCERVTAVGEALPERLEVLDDAVVHHGDAARWVELRVGVAVGWRAVGGPARVADARGRRGQLPLDAVCQVVELARGAREVELLLVVEERDAGRVVAAVLQAPEAFEEERSGGPRAGIADDAAHVRSPRVRPRRD